MYWLELMVLLPTTAEKLIIRKEVMMREGTITVLVTAADNIGLVPEEAAPGMGVSLRMI